MAQKILALARSLLGNPGGEKFWKAYGFTYRVEWCCIFVWYVFHSLGLDSLFFGGQKTAYVPYLWNWARENHQTTTDPQPGDLIIFDWNANQIPDHVGIVESVTDNIIHTLEGNVSDQAQAVSRPRDNKILGFIHIQYPQSSGCDPETCPIINYLKTIMKGE